MITGSRLLLVHSHIQSRGQNMTLTFKMRIKVIVQIQLNHSSPQTAKGSSFSFTTASPEADP